MRSISTAARCCARRLRRSSRRSHLRWLDRLAFGRSRYDLVVSAEPAVGTRRAGAEPRGQRRAFLDYVSLRKAPSTPTTQISSGNPS